MVNAASRSKRLVPINAYRSDEAGASLCRSCSPSDVRVISQRREPRSDQRDAGLAEPEVNAAGDPQSAPVAPAHRPHDTESRGRSRSAFKPSGTEVSSMPKRIKQRARKVGAIDIERSQQKRHQLWRIS